MPHNITKELKENMSTFKTKTIALMASSLIVAVAGLSFATTPAFAKAKKTPGPIFGSKNPKKQGQAYPTTAKQTSSAPKAAKPGFANGGVPNK